MISTSRTSDFRISGSAISSHKNIHMLEEMNQALCKSSFRKDKWYIEKHDHKQFPLARTGVFPSAGLAVLPHENIHEGIDHLKGNRIELSEEGKQALNQKISQLWKGQEITIKYFTDGYYENVAGVLDAVDVINKELRIYKGFINDTGKELPTIIAFEDILEIGVNMT